MTRHPEVPQDTARAFIRKNNLTDKIKCLVTFYGMPIRIGPHKMTPADQQEMVLIRQQMEQLPPQILPRTNASSTRPWYAANRSA